MNYFQLSAQAQAQPAKQILVLEDRVIRPAINTSANETMNENEWNAPNLYDGQDGTSLEDIQDYINGMHFNWFATRMTLI